MSVSTQLRQASDVGTSTQRELCKGLLPVRETIVGLRSLHAGVVDHSYSSE